MRHETSRETISRAYSRFSLKLRSFGTDKRIKRDQKGSKRSELSCHPILLARSERVQSTQASSPEIAPDHNRYLYPWAILMSLGTLNGVYCSAGESAILPSLFRWHNSLRVNLSDRCKAFLQHPPSCPMGVASVRVWRRLSKWRN